MTASTNPPVNLLRAPAQPVVLFLFFVFFSPPRSAETGPCVHKQRSGPARNILGMSGILFAAATALSPSDVTPKG